MGVFQTRRRAKWLNPNRRKWIPFKPALTHDKKSRDGGANDNREKPVFEAHFAGPGVAEAGSELPCFGRQKGKMFSYRREIPCYFWSGRNRVPLPCGTITFLFCLHLSDYKQHG